MRTPDERRDSIYTQTVNMQKREFRSQFSSRSVLGSRQANHVYERFDEGYDSVGSTRRSMHVVAARAVGSVGVLDN